MLDTGTARHVHHKIIFCSFVLHKLENAGELLVFFDAKYQSLGTRYQFFPLFLKITRYQFKNLFTSK